MALPLSYCASLVRAHDYDRYLCALFAPPAVREDWFALFAFNHEIAAIAETVSEEMLGFIRFAWWREALDEIYGDRTVRRHPVADALAATIRNHRLPRAAFDALLAARETDLEAEPVAMLADLEAYCRETSSSLLRLCMAVAGGEATPALDALGIAWALIGFARSGSRTALSQSELIAAATEELQKAAGESRTLLAPFYAVARYHLRVLQNDGAGGSPHGRRLRLAFYLWRKSLFAFA